jgi:hypothetical protein
MAQIDIHSHIRRTIALALAWMLAMGSVPASAAPTKIASSARAFPSAAAPPAAAPDQRPTQNGFSGSAGNDETADPNEWGQITVAQPKIWQYERVNTLLDGLLRDVEGVSLADLTALDPNATNGAAVKFVQSMLEIGVQYNQAAAVTNALALQNYRATQGIATAQIQANSQYLTQLYQQRQNATTQLLAAQNQASLLQQQLAVTDPTSTNYTTINNQLTAANSSVNSYQQELATINTQITSASTPTASMTPPTLTPTTGPTPPETANTFTSFLGNLPSGLQQSIKSQLQSPSFPATKRLDNFITLLYERLARQVSALQDDLMRDPNNYAFLVQFDVGLYPSKEASDDVAKVQFTLKNCVGCKVYSVYPGQSSYNLANYEGASRRNSFTLGLETLFGLGINADYRRQEDTLHGDLIQSVYVSGFQEANPESSDGNEKNAEQTFGWYYGAAPFEKLVTPGIRSTFAIITVPRSAMATAQSCANSQNSSNKDQCALNALFQVDSGAQDSDVNPALVGLKIESSRSWVPRNDPTPAEPTRYASRTLRVPLPGTDSLDTIPDVVLAERDRLHVLGLEYNPVYTPPPPPKDASTDSSKGASPPGTATASATGTGPGTATASVSAAGTATASSSGTGSTVANASASSPPTPPAAAASGSSSDSFSGCPKDQCASVLVKLAEPIDPNLVVTVRGEPLRRVRDWRGRATSILPPVQSESDVLPAPAGTTTTTTASSVSPYESVASRSLLEADNLGPDTWLQVDSHRLLLTISRKLGDIGEFPTIQIIAPAKRALFIPTDLDEGFTEIITNGFHLPARNGRQLGAYVSKSFFGLSDPVATLGRTQSRAC